MLHYMWYTVKFQMANSIDFVFLWEKLFKSCAIFDVFLESIFFILERWFSGYIPLVRHWVLLRLMVVVTMEINISFHVCKLDKNRVKHFILKKTTNEFTVVKLSFCNRLSSTFLFIIQFWQHWIVFFSIGCHWSEQHNSKSVMKSNSYFNNKDK